MSSWISAHAVPLAALTIYLAVIVAHAWHGHRSTRGISDYYVGGRSMGGLVIGLSFYATYFSTNSFIGFAGESYDLGFAWMAMGLVLLLCAVVSWHVVAPRLRLATEKFGIATLVCFATCSLWRVSNPNGFPERYRDAYWTLTFVGLGALITTSYWGGLLVFKFGVGLLPPS